MTKKSKKVFSKTYKKDVIYNPEGRKDVIKLIKECENLHPIEAGKYEDGKEYLIIKIDRI